MATKPRDFDTRLVYHIYNCGVAKQRIFVKDNLYSKFTQIITYYKHLQHLPLSHYENLSFERKEEYINTFPKNAKSERIVILAYCLMPNHYHLMIRPKYSHDPSKFIGDIQNSYTKYFNALNNRIGALFQGPFKSKKVDADNAVLNLSRYIHLNPYRSSKVNPSGNRETLQRYPFSSYPHWLASKEHLFLNLDEIRKWVSLAGGSKGYKSFVTSGIDTRPTQGIESTVLEKDLD